MPFFMHSHRGMSGGLEFVAAYDAARAIASRVSVMLGDRTAIFFYGFDEDSRDALSARLKSEEPRLSKGGTRWPLESPEAP